MTVNELHWWPTDRGSTFCLLVHTLWSTRDRSLHMVYGR